MRTCLVPTRMTTSCSAVPIGQLLVNAETVQVKSPKIQLSGKATNQALTVWLALSRLDVLSLFLAGLSSFVSRKPNGPGA
jgi:hypothetical protein